MDHTALQQVIWFSMQDARGPPGRLRLFGINALRDARDNLASIVREVNLFPGLDELDIRLCDGAAVQLLEVFECFFVVSPE